MTGDSFCPRCGSPVAPCALLCRACRAPVQGREASPDPQVSPLDPAAGRRVRPVALAVGVAAALLLVAFVMTIVVSMIRARGPHGWSVDSAAIEQRRLGTLTVIAFTEDWDAFRQGSGFVVDPSGTGVTNVHVLRYATHAVAVLGDGRRFDILSVTAWSATRDLAVFRMGRDLGREGIEYPTNLHPLLLAKTGPPHVGDWVATMTSPKGLSGTLSDGLVSAVREREMGQLIQTSAPISPGSSGGPVFDQRGDVVGVTVSQVADAQNLNFAVPVDSLRPLLSSDSLLDLERFQRAALASAWNTKGLDDSSSTRFSQCVAHFVSEDYDRALRDVLPLCDRCPVAPSPQLVAGMCFDRLKQEAQAAPHFQRYLGLADSVEAAESGVTGWLKEHGHPRPKAR